MPNVNNLTIKGIRDITLNDISYCNLLGYKIKLLGNSLLSRNKKDEDEQSRNIDYLDFKIKQARESFEKNYLSYNLRKYNNNISLVSQKIGMERTALYRKLKSLKINSGS